MRQLQWKREENRGCEIGGKTVGIIGYGNTGRAFAKKISGFGCEVLTYDKYLINCGDNFAIQVSMEELKAEAEIVSLHIPYSEENHYLVDRDFLFSFEKDIYLINTSRGKVLRTEDLVTALESGKVKGACLDVLEYERHSFESLAQGDLPSAMAYLISSEKVLLSPHVAGWTVESYYKLSSVLYDKIKAWMESGPA